MRSHFKALWVATALGLITSNVQGATQTELIDDSPTKTFAPSEIMLFLERPGCHGFCLPYRVTIFGTGDIEFDDLQGEDDRKTQRGKIPEEVVLNLVNAFLHVRFFDAVDTSVSHSMQIRKGRWRLSSVSVADIPEFRLGLRIGSLEKSVLFQVSDQKSFDALAEEIDLHAETAQRLRNHPLCSEPDYASLSVCSAAKD